MAIFNMPRDSMSEVLDNFLTPSGITIEEGIVIGRVFNKNTIDATKAGVNMPDSALQQSLWNGQYSVKLRRGFGIPAVYCTGTFGRGAHEQEVLAYGESVCVMWLDRSSMSVPIILKGTSLEYYQKLLTGNGHLLDSGEKIYRAAISKKPEDTQASGYPFADNQTDNPQTAPSADGSFTKNDDKAIKNPGGELFCDKFGRVVLTSRHLEHEFLVTIGKTDSGQDDSTNLTTKAQQDAYYDGISNDESSPEDSKEPFAPKPLNLVQYQLLKEQQDNVVNGYLPRFDLWKFQPIVIRDFDAGTDGKKRTDTVYSVYQLRGNATNGNAYAFTITQAGDLKEFVARNENRRIVGDSLVSVGNNYNLRVRKSGDTAATFDFAVMQDGTCAITSQTSLTITTENGTILKSPSSNPNIESMVLGDTLKQFLDLLQNTVFSAWVPIPMDGGIALKTLLMNWLTSIAPLNYLSANNKVN